jgi:hypothetical protein
MGVSTLADVSDRFVERAMPLIWNWRSAESSSEMDVG